MAGLIGFEIENVYFIMLRHDTLTTNGQFFALSGRSLSGGSNLARVPAHQEFWHNWHTFHPKTGR